AIVLEIVRNSAPIIEHDLHADAIDTPYGSKRAVLHPKSALVAQEHDPVPTREHSYATGHLQADVVAQFTGVAHPGSRRLVERADIVVGVRQDDAAARRLLLPIPIPPLDQLLACVFARSGRMHMTRLIIGRDRLSCSLGRELARRITLPVLALPANGRDL